MTALVIHGTPGDDNLDGTVGDDTFGLGGGGNDTVNGEGGNDTFRMFGALTAADKIDGGSGIDRVTLNGDYTGANAVVFAADTIVNVEKIVLAQGHSYDLTSNDATVASGEKLAINASALGAGDSLTFDGSAETNGRFVFFAGAGNDTIIGGALADTFNLTMGGNDTVHGGGGADQFYLGDMLTSADVIDGGAGRDTVHLSGMGEDPIIFTATTMTNVETLVLGAGFDYALTTDDATVANHAILTVDASALGSGDTISFDGSAETDGAFHFIGGGSNQITLSGGAGNDVFDMTGIQAFALTTLSGGGGNDTFQFLDNFDSSSQIIDGGTGINTLSLNGDYSAISLVGGGIIDNIQAVTFAGGHSYTGVTIFDDVTGGGALSINATGLLAGDTLSLDASLSSDALIVRAGDGTYTLTGSALDDKFNMGAHFSASDSIEGGGGSDTLTLSGDYTGANALAFNATTITDISVLLLGAGHSYDITIADETVGPSQIMRINALNLGPGDSLTFDGSADTDGILKITAGAGNDVITGGQFVNFIDLSYGGNDTVHSSGGLSQVYMGGALTAADTIDGGLAGAIVELNGDYTGAHAVTFSATTMTNVLEIDLDAGHSYDLTSNDATIANGGVLTVDGSFLGVGDSVKFDGSAETNGSFELYDGLGNDVLKGGAGDDFLSFDGGGTDTGKGNGGADFFDACGHLDSTDQFDGGSGYDIMELTASETASGNYTGADALHLSTAMMLNFEELDLDDGGSYDITTADGNVASGVTFTVDASFLSSLYTLALDVSAETNGFFDIIGGAGDDTVRFAGNYVAADTFDGGGGNDTLSINGTYTLGNTLVLSDTAITSVETVKLASSSGLSLVSVTGDIADGSTLTIDASAEGGTGSVIDLTNATSAAYNLIGGAVTDEFVFGDNFSAAVEITSATLLLAGDYASAITLSDTKLTKMSAVGFEGANDFAASVVGNISAGNGSGGTLTVESAVTAGHTVSIDLTQATSSSYAVLNTQPGSLTVKFAGNFSSADQVMGQSVLGSQPGAVTLELDGNYSSGLTFGTGVIVQTLKLDSGFSYNFTTIDANVTAGKTMTVDASALGAANTLTFNGAAETNGSFSFIGGAGNDTLTGGALADTFDMSNGGNDTVHGNGGNDTFKFGAALTTADIVDGGTGNDTLELNGAYSNYTFASGQLTSIETLKLDGGFSYTLAAASDTVAAGATMIVDFSSDNTGHTSSFNGTNNVGTGIFHFIAGTAATITLVGGAGDDIIDLTNAVSNSVRAAGNDGNDTFLVGANFNSWASKNFDGGAGNDTMEFNGDYSGGNAITIANLFANIETLKFDTGHNYTLTSNNANVAAGATMTVDGSALGTGDSLTFTGTAETDGHFAFIGGAGTDTLTGGTQSDTFDLSVNDGTITDTAHGGGGNDSFTLGGTGTNLDTIDGGTGSDTIVLTGDLSFATLNSTRDTSIETVSITAAASLTVIGDIAGGGQTLHIDASTSSGFVGVDLSQATSTLYTYTGSATQGDTIVFGANFNVNDTIDGGGAPVFDTLSLNGDYSGGNALVFKDTTIANINLISVGDGFSYNLTLTDADIANGGNMMIDGSTLTAGHTLTVNDSAETTVGVEFTGGAGNDVFHAGVGADQLNGGDGNDLLDAGAGDAVIFGGGGQDTITVDATPGAAQLFEFSAVSDSTGSSYDIIHNVNFNFAQFSVDTLETTPLSGINTAVTHGTLDTGASFDSELAIAIGAGQLGSHHAVLFTVDSSSTGLTGHTFLVVDVNGTAGYQAGADLVMDVTGYTGTLTAGEFI